MSISSKVTTKLLSLKEEHGNFFSDQTSTTINNLVNKLYYTAVDNKLWWSFPSISKSNVDDAVVLEWWNNGRRYSIYVIEEEIDYYAQWGVKDDDWIGETESGDINIENTLLDFWSWIGSDND